MKINRHNYETFFLLYTDNELTQAGRREVEQFVQDNPDIQEEFLSFKRLVLPPEEISFYNKGLLLKNEMNDDVLEQMLLHIDGELDPRQEELLLQQIKTDGHLANELSLLQSSKLDADEKIVFEHKAVLYRHSRQPRVVYMKIARWAVAAILLGVGFFATYQYLSPTAKNPVEVASNINENNQPNNNNVVIKKNPHVDTGKPTLDVAKTNAVPDEGLSQQQTGIEKDQKPVTNKNIQANKESQEMAVKNKIQKNKESFNNIQKENNEPQNLVRNVIESPGLKEINSGTQNEKLTKQVQQNNISFANKEKMEMVPIASFASNNTGLQQLQTDDNTNTVLGVDEESITKSKAGILLRKVKRLVERNTKIKTNKTFKIAGFEIATL